MSSLLQNPGFGKLIPGFDFLQTLAKGAAQNIPQLPNLGNWVAPTLNVEELEKRIDELKAVQFWLDQNATALKATIQALEVQKMTLATLHGMNFNMGDVANAFKLKAADAVMSGVQKAAEKVAAADAAADNMATKPPSKVRGKPSKRELPEGRRPAAGRAREVISLWSCHASAVAHGGGAGAGPTARPHGAARLCAHAGTGPALHHGSLCVRRAGYSGIPRRRVATGDRLVRHRGRRHRLQ